MLDNAASRFPLEDSAQSNPYSSAASSMLTAGSISRTPTARERPTPPRKPGHFGCWGAIRARKETSGYVLHLGPRLERGGRRTTASHQSRGHKPTSPIPGVKPKPLQTKAIHPPEPNRPQPAPHRSHRSSSLQAAPHNSPCKPHRPRSNTPHQQREKDEVPKSPGEIASNSAISQANCLQISLFAGRTAGLRGRT